LVTAVTRAIDTWAEPHLWERMRQNAMQQDFSWRRSANKYLTLFERAVSGDG